MKEQYIKQVEKELSIQASYLYKLPISYISYI